MGMSARLKKIIIERKRCALHARNVFFAITKYLLKSKNTLREKNVYSAVKIELRFITLNVS